MMAIYDRTAAMVSKACACVSIEVIHKFLLQQITLVGSFVFFANKSIFANERGCMNYQPDDDLLSFIKLV